MLSSIKSSFAAITLGLTLSGLALTAACQSVEVSTGPDGVKIKIIGDDGRMVLAKGLEEALQQALDYLATATTPEFRADWKEIIQNILKEKGEQQFSMDSMIEKAKANGELTESTDENGETIYNWTATGSGP